MGLTWSGARPTLEHGLPGVCKAQWESCACVLGNCIAFTNARSCVWRVGFLCYWAVMLACRIATEWIIDVPGSPPSPLPSICTHCGGCEGMAQEHCQSIWHAEHSASHQYKLLCCHFLLAMHFPGLAVLLSLAVMAQLLPQPGTNILSSAAVVSPPPPVSYSLLTHCPGAPSSSSSCFQPYPWENLSGFSPPCTPQSSHPLHGAMPGRGQVLRGTLRTQHFCKAEHLFSNLERV